MRLFARLAQGARGRAWRRAASSAAVLVPLALAGACSNSVPQVDALPTSTWGPSAMMPDPKGTPAPDAPDGEPEAAPPAATCGDGKVVRSDGETCDPSSPDGKCVSQCEDDNPCTEDSLRGSAKRCNARCVHRPLTGIVDDAACCEAGAELAMSDCNSPDAPLAPATPDACSDCDDASSGLIHRYSFEGTGPALVDSVGMRDGTMSVGFPLNGSGSLELLPWGGPYGILPAGLISDLSSATIEVWVTLRTRIPAARIFEFGSRSLGGLGGQAATSWALSAISFLNGNPITLVNFSPEADATDDQYALAQSPLGTGVQYHLASVFDADSGSLLLYVDGELAASNPAINGTLADLDDALLWIGRPLDQSGPAMDAQVHELRIYDRALDADALRASGEAGPDALPSAR